MSLFDKPNFTAQYGNNDFSIRNEDGTLSEERGDSKPKPSKGEAADIISASADGLDSIGGIMSLFMGKTPSSEPTYNNPPPPAKKKVNPLLIGGIIGGVALIILLIVLNNGKSNPSPKS